MIRSVTLDRTLFAALVGIAFTAPAFAETDCPKMFKDAKIGSCDDIADDQSAVFTACCPPRASALGEKKKIGCFSKSTRTLPSGLAFVPTIDPAGTPTPTGVEEAN